jgi:uncharacterized protein
MRKINFFLCFTLVVLVQHLWAQDYYLTPSEIPNPKEFSDGFVSDPNDYLSEYQEGKINLFAQEVRDSKGFEIAVVVVKSINYQSALQFATDLGNLWKVGKENRGLVFLVAVEDREMAMATGYETEMYLPDLLTKEISEQEVISFFKEDRYGKGVLEGVKALRNILMDENVPHYAVPILERVRHSKWWINGSFIAVLALLLIAIIVNPSWKNVMRIFIVALITSIVAVIAVAINENEPLRWHNVVTYFAILNFIAIGINTFITVKVNSKSLFFHFLTLLLYIGMLVYGLYIIGLQDYIVVYLVCCGVVFVLFLLFYIATFFEKDPYHKFHTIKLFQLDVFAYLFPFPMYVVDMLVEIQMEAWRNRIRFSPKTGLEMRKLCEVEDDKYLESGQITEEKVKSVDYDVWISDEPEDVLILNYEKWFTKYSSCEKCKFKTWYLVYDKTITAATYSSSGTGESKKECEHCKHAVIARYTIPRLEKSSSSSNSGSSSSGGSSGRSSGGSSWGGGSFGGGGSSSRW